MPRPLGRALLRWRPRGAPRGSDADETTDEVGTLFASNFELVDDDDESSQPRPARIPRCRAGSARCQDHLDTYRSLRDSADSSGHGSPDSSSSSTSSRLLADALPDFVSGLVRIAATGRSLGRPPRARDPAARRASSPATCEPTCRSASAFACATEPTATTSSTTPGAAALSETVAGTRVPACRGWPARRPPDGARRWSR